ncbi:ABC transporter family substrate-binding protein [Actinokineospora globicatena]|uniref:Peptide ABC transporter substrate-binding protein n=1 Tax=Actinokineospora globicatena TaxID=103729 RepID=A0A9W6QQB0_9PSEU|nr:ABC transporter family substrate-binding protein [Actinokineospora globicatena]MCP2300485.1 peptide/nickel transport system substrate-binding protein [Actinokineospora globicatena]GLW81020.1 peptide ABC transporter substrate-binding protein [Actinokineospora globicatena]GLW88213.1 peptide ABC transporter substrate-binding protein [Actinokineospora globicatena]GLW92692.1 peptide ABC transporter substrate-binding protein [Actinokineospora globicatena]
MSTKRNSLSAIALVVGASLVLSACGGGSSDNGGSTGAQEPTGDIASMAIAKGESGDEYTSPEVPQSTDTFVVSTDNPYTAYNNSAADANNSYNTFALAQVISGAYKLDGNNKVLLNKDVMESVEVTSKSPQVVTWKIKPGVTWSDGEPWDCDDFYLAWLSSTGKSKGADGKDIFTSANTTGYELIDKVECPSLTEVVTTFGTSYPDYKGLFGISLDIMPAHILEKETGVADVTKLTPTGGDQAALGKVAEFWKTKWNGFTKELMPASGAYQITAFEQNNSVTLERNPKWLGKPGGPAKIVLRGISDQVAQAQALENGEVQVNSMAQPDANAAERLRGLSSQGVRFGASNGLSFEHMDLNFKNKWFADQAVRKAFMQCVNRDELAEKLIRPVLENAKPLGSLVFFQAEEGYTDNYAQYKGDAAAAKSTLEGAGYTIGGDGIATKGGEKVSIKISHTDIPRRKQTVELIQSQCKPAGIEVIDDTDPNFLDTRVSQGDYDVALFAWSAAPFKSSQKAIYETGGGQNWSNYGNSKVDAAYKDASSNLDEAASRKAFQEADRLMAEDNYSLPLYQLPNMWAFKGIDKVYFQSYNGALWNANEWVKTS